MRLGIFGGSFDPVHYGHLLLAESCREQCRLDEVWFLPAASPPHKQQRRLTAATHRVAMLHLAIAGYSPFRVSSLEIERGGVSYTVETLRHVRMLQPEAELFFLMGADSLADLPNWREPVELLQLATPVVVRRRGAPEPQFSQLQPLVSPERLASIQTYAVEMPVIELSSTELRARSSLGRSLRYQTPRAVERYIVEHRLY